MRTVPVIGLLLLVTGMGCSADTSDDAAIPPASAADTEPAARVDTAQRGAPPAREDESESAPAAVAGAAWTAGDTHAERTVRGAALLRGMRTARHEGFDRIVLDFGADDVPTYSISYVDRPVRQCGSGNTVPLAGDAWLALTVQPANAHTDEGAPTVRERERAPRLPSLLELKMTCDFEAVVEVVAGVASPERYRAFVLETPNRLVVDIRHPAAR